jgi:hypothetical protein
MTEQRSLTERWPVPPRDSEEYQVWRETRLPAIKARLAQIHEDMRWIAEGHYKVPGARLPSDRRR